MQNLVDWLIADLTVSDEQVPTSETLREGIAFFGAMFIIAVVILLTGGM